MADLLLSQSHTWRWNRAHTTVPTLCIVKFPALFRPFRPSYSDTILGHKQEFRFQLPGHKQEFGNGAMTATTPKYKVPTATVLSDTIVSTGEIECKLQSQQSWQNENIFEWLHITHDFYHQSLRVNQVKLANRDAMDVSLVRQTDNQCVAAFNKCVHGDHTQTVWIELTVRCDVRLRFWLQANVTVSLIPAANACSRLSLECTEYRLQATQIAGVSYHDVRAFALHEAVLELYQLLLPLSVFKLIFQGFYTDCFDSYGEPFMCDSLCLDTDEFVLRRKLPPGKSIARHLNVFKVLIMTQRDQAPRECHINGVRVTLHPTNVDEFRLLDIDLESLEIDDESLCGIWLMEDAKPLFEFIDIRDSSRSELGEDNLEVKAELLLDVNLAEDDKFMLWIEWKDNLSQASVRTAEYPQKNPLRLESAFRSDLGSDNNGGIDCTGVIAIEHGCAQPASLKEQFERYYTKTVKTPATDFQWLKDQHKAKQIAKRKSKSFKHRQQKRCSRSKYQYNRW